MNDTEIVDQLIKWMKPYLDGNIPAPPVSIGYAMTWIEIQRGDRRKVTHIIHDPKNHDYDEHCACGACDKVRSHQRKSEFGSSTPKAEGSTVCRYCFYGPDECYCTGAKLHQLQLRGRAKGATPAAPTRAHVGDCRLDTDLRPGEPPAAEQRTQQPDVGKHAHVFGRMVGGVQDCLWYGCKVQQCNGVVVDQHTPATSTHTRIGGVPIRTAGGPYLTAADVLGRPGTGKLVADILNSPLAALEPPQAFWRCKHYPSAIHNWWTAEQCEWGCHNHSPTWDSNGDSK